MGEMEEKRDEWRDYFNEKEKKKDINTAHFAAAAIIVITMISVIVLFSPPPGNDVSRLIDKSGYTLPEGTRVVVRFYDGEGTFTRSYVITDQSVAEGTVSDYDARITAPESYVERMKQGDVCGVLKELIAARDYTLESSLSRAELESKYSSLRNCFE